jgi:hypothetical protein
MEEFTVYFGETGYVSKKTIRYLSRHSAAEFRDERKV